MKANIFGKEGVGGVEGVGKDCIEGGYRFDGFVTLKENL